MAISRATVIEYLLERLLAFHMLDSGYVKTEEIKKIPIRLQLLLSNRLDAAVLPEPLLTLAQIKGAAIIADDRELSTCLTVIAISKKALKKETGLVSRFLDAYTKSVTAINADPESFKTLLVEKTRFPRPAKDRFLVPVFPQPGLPSSADIMEVWGWLKQKNMVSGDFSADAAVIRPAN